MLILFADDESECVELLAVVLRRRGHDVLTCEEGKDVLPLVEQHRPEVLVLDLEMPGMNGLDIAEELQHHPDLKSKLMVAMSGRRDEAEQQAATRAGFDCLLAKPLSVSRLLSACASIASSMSWNQDDVSAPTSGTSRVVVGRDDDRASAVITSLVGRILPPDFVEK